MGEKSMRERLFVAGQMVGRWLRPAGEPLLEGAAASDPVEVSRLTDEAFVAWAYQTIFNRAPDEIGGEQYAAALRRGRLSRAHFLITLLSSDEYRDLWKNREFVPSGHFFSAVPSQAERQRFLANSAPPQPMLAVDLRHEQQMALLNDLLPHAQTCPFPEQPQTGFRYHFDNPAYAHSDGLMLHCMIRHFKPRRIIEIGCGYSSTVIMDTNERFFDGEIDVRFIDPYPELVHELMSPGDSERYPVTAEPVQTVDLALFEALKVNDILFIDSTHVSKLGSDVNRELFDILPRLNPGVLVHIHDIIWPFEYPAEWIEEGRAWNENYLVRAFLSYNDTFEIVLFTDYLHSHPQASRWLKDNMPLTRKNTGAQLWIRKVN